MKTPLAALLLGASLLVRVADLAPIVEIEEEVYAFTDAGNGAGPMWCAGSTTLVRAGDFVFASGLETVAGAQPLNNCRWVLFRREAQGWARVRVDESLTREPAPLATFSDGRVLVSVNPTLGVRPPTKAGPARPDVIQIESRDPRGPAVALTPEWQGAPRFTEHSYRSFAADGPAGEFVLLQNVGYTHTEWTFRDRTGKWSAHGQLPWPWGAEYDKPQPARVCYPTVAVQGRAVHLCGVSDIVEPYGAGPENCRITPGRGSRFSRCETQVRFILPSATSRRLTSKTKPTEATPAPQVYDSRVIPPTPSALVRSVRSRSRSWNDCAWRGRNC
ncbi:MAG: hypothetical protein EXS32_06315 [Opitutus sp.]|nr:hypothetical protein [Opitutus sp.]